MAEGQRRVKQTISIRAGVYENIRLVRRGWQRSEEGEVLDETYAANPAIVRAR